MKFFRNTAKRAKPKSVFAYLKYALSEIFLVVLGILIAVSINNRNEDNKQRKGLKNIYSTIKEDLTNDLTEIDEVLSYYEVKNDVFRQVLTDSIGREDYYADKVKAFLILGYPEISIDKRGYHLISDYNSTSDNQEDSLVTNIIEFYTERLLEIQVDDNLRASDFDENFKYWKNNADWWADYIHKKEIDGFLEYALNSQDYKSRVATSHFITYEVFLPELGKFKEGALKIIKAIEERENQ